MAVRIIAHRGASADAPENTMRAFRLARDVGAAGVETDIQMTSDGVPVLFHDHLAGKLGHPDIGIHERPVAFWEAHDPAPPRLDELLTMIDSDFELLAEIKVARGTDDAHNRRLTETVIDLLRRRGCLAHTRILCFHPRILAWCREIEPGLRVVLDIEHRPREADLAFLDHIDGFSPDVDILESVGHLATERGLELATWTVNDESRFEIARRCGADLILTDRPAWALDLLR